MKHDEFFEAIKRAARTSNAFSEVIEGAIGPIPGGFVIDSQTQKVVHDANAFNEALRRLRETITFNATLMLGQDSGASPARIVEGTITSVTSTNAQPQPPLTFDAMMEAVSSLPPIPDSTPLRANLWTLDRLRKAIPDAKSPGTTQNWFGLVFSGVIIEVDVSLPDGVIKRGDEVLCNIKKGKE